MLIDTHCHLHDLQWFTPNQQVEFLQDAHESGVEKIVCIGTNHEDSLKARDFAATHDGVYWTYGIHPEFAGGQLDKHKELPFLFEVSKIYRPSAESDVSSPRDSSRPTGSERSEQAARNDGPARTGREENEAPGSTLGRNKLIAVGEIGLDYHYPGYDRSAQIKLFEQMLQLAKDYGLPVSLHIREAFTDAFAVLDNFPGARGVVHSFTGSKKELKRALERDFYIGVNGLVTYTTPPLPPLERILLETDAPFLTPVPFRGTINKPGYVKQIAAYLATKLEVTELEIAEQTTKNARQIFKI